MPQHHPLASVGATVTPRLFSLWDTMAHTDPADMDGALTTLMRELCEVLRAHTANSIVTVRMPVSRKKDPTQGWRPRHTVHLHMTAQARDNMALTKRCFRDDRHQHDITVVRNVSFAGTWRAKRLVDLVPPEWFESEFYDRYYAGIGARDALWVGCPINRDMEVFFGLYRNEQQPWFSATDGDVALVILRSLSWFLQRYVLSLGLDLATDPLTPTERDVLRLLLSGRTQEQMAELLNQSPHTTHDHIKAIYRKFNVGSRTALSALWLGLNTE